MPIPSEKELLDAACHFGHKKEKWNPKMAPYIYGTQQGIHIIDLVQTKQHLEDVCNALKKMQKEGKTILFVSTKQQSTQLLEDVANNLNQPFVTKKWIPGLLTNWNTLKKRLKYYMDLQDSFKTGDVGKYTKTEQTRLRKKLAKLDNALSGVSNLEGPPDAVFIIDAVRDHVAVLEAKKLKIPLYGICDCNANPDEFTICVPANDDAYNSIRIILETVETELGGSGKRTVEALAPKVEEEEAEPVAAES